MEYSNYAYSLKNSNTSIIQFCFQGQILNFTGSIIYCLHENIINHIEISLSPAVYHYLGTGQLNEAYQLACFGLTDQDWKVIGRMALNKLNLKVGFDKFQSCYS